MSLACKSERKLLSHDELAIVMKTRQPEVLGLGLEELRSLHRNLRALRDKETTLAEHKARVVRGKAELRGASFPGTAEQPKRRKQVFSNSLKRLNSEIGRVKKLAARQALIQSAQRALSLRACEGLR